MVTSNEMSPHPLSSYLIAGSQKTLARARALPRSSYDEHKFTSFVSREIVNHCDECTWMNTFPLQGEEWLTGEAFVSRHHSR